MWWLHVLPRPCWTLRKVTSTLWRKLLPHKLPIWQLHLLHKAWHALRQHHNAARRCRRHVGVKEWDTLPLRGWQGG